MPPLMQVILDWTSLTVMVTAIFFSGVVWNKIKNLEQKQSEMTEYTSLNVRLDELSNEMERIRDRLDRFIDGTVRPKRVP